MFAAALATRVSLSNDATHEMWIALAALLFLLSPTVAAAHQNKAAGGNQNKASQSGASAGIYHQLRGAMVTPNWQVPASLFTLTPAQQHAEIQEVCAVGGNLIRVHLDWAYLEPDAPGRIDEAYLSRVDQVLSWAARCQIRVILNVIGSPCWVTQPSGAPFRVCSGSTWLFRPSAQPGQFQRISSFLLARYPSLYAYEVWNEPNGSFWLGTPAQYAALVNEAVTAKDATGSPTKILAGVMLMNGTSYLDQLYRAGMHGQTGISLHPYSMGCPSKCGAFVDPSRRRSPFRTAIESTRAMMLRHRDRGGMWLTEFGFATCPAQPGCVSEGIQSSWLARSFQVAAHYRYVKGLTMFSLRDIAASQDVGPAWDLRCGILHKDFTPKPAYMHLQRVFSHLP